MVSGVLCLTLHRVTDSTFCVERFSGGSAVTDDLQPPPAKRHHQGVICCVNMICQFIWFPIIFGLFTASQVSMETVHVDPDTSPQDSILGRSHPPQDDDRVSPC